MTLQPNATEIQRFFAMLYPEVEEGWLVLSHPDVDPAHINPKTGKRWLRSVWLDIAQTSLARAAEIAATLSRQDIVYFGVALQRPERMPAPYHRSTIAGAYVVPGLWCDLDLAYGQHAASTLPATDAEALDFLSTLPAPPSLILHSGGGMYGYWLFKEPSIITTSAELEASTQLSQRFTHTVVETGKQRGWTLDALGDLARVLRPPGSINYKYGKLVEVLHDSTLADDAKEDAVLDALHALAPLDMITWMKLKKRLKAAVPALNLSDLERARHELRRTAAPQATSASGSSQAQIAAALAKEYAGQFAYDLTRQAWMAYDNGLWKPLETERVTQQVMACMDTVLQGNYTWNTCAGVEHLLRARLAQTVPLETPGWLPFHNGALHLETMALHPHRPDRPFTWQLPHAYDPQATCPTTLAWLHEAVGGAHDQVQVLRAYAKAVVTRRVDLHRYLETLGPGGTGKGTYTRLLMALVGCENPVATELKHLEANRFELSQLRGKVLMVITDAERYSGPVNALKAITGQDFVRMEEKFKAPRTEVAPVMVVVAANEPVQSADYTSGLVRRRLAMTFRHRPAVPRDLLSWHAGAWRGDLAPEIPGILNWVLALPDAQMEALLQQTTTLVPSLQATWAQSLVDTNPLAEWANQALMLDARTDAEGYPLAVVNVGRAHRLDQSNGYEHQDRWLYSHYRAWVDDTGGKPLSSRRFTGLLRDLFENQLRLDGVTHTDDMYGSRFHGLRLRTASDAEAPCLITGTSPPLTGRTPVMTADTRVHDGCDACDGFVHDLSSPLTPPCPCDDPSQGGGNSLKEDAIHLS